MPKTYDELGFPVPTEFETPGDATNVAAHPLGRRSASRRKRWLIVAVLVGGLLPAALLPKIVPVARQAVCRWSLERAFACEVRDDLPGAIREVERALAWQGEDADLRSLLAMLRLENGDHDLARAAASRAVALAPTAVGPYRVRAIVHVCLGEHQQALDDAAKVVQLSGADNAEGLNLRSYVRAVVGRELPEALADIERAVAMFPSPPAELIDTHGFLLHLVGRHEESLAEMNRAVGLVRDQRRQVMLLSDRVDRVELLRRMRSLDHGLGVMLHHRGLASRALGLEEQANADFELAERKGYNPSRGIF